ncbi:MAG: LysM peptidoglycan-binding domain-containing protein [Opitutales bacterium]
MNLVPVFAVVIAIHVGVIGLLMVTPGCQSSPPAAEDTAPASQTGAPEAHRQAVAAAPESTASSSRSSVASAGSEPASRQPPQPPMRPTATWNIDPDPVPLPGTPAEDERSGTGLNAPGMEGTGEPLMPSRQSSAATSEPPPLQPVREAGPSRSTGSTSTYTVRSGDSLSRIARQQGVSVDALMVANNLTPSSTIYPGDELTIPGPGASSASPSSTSTAPTTTAADGTYTVQPGDTLSRIASRQGTTISALRRANNLSGDLIRVGQVLTIPGGGTAAPPSNSNPAPSTGDGGTYEVKPGDTLGVLSQRFGVSVAELQRANNLSDPRQLRAGQQLTIPRPADASQNRQPARTAPAASAPSNSNVPLPDDPPSRQSAEPTAPDSPEDTEATDDSGFDELDLENAPVNRVQRGG